MKFPIIGNIEQVFTRLVNEGKTTIRFKEPENDLCIHGRLIISLAAKIMILNELICFILLYKLVG